MVSLRKRVSKFHQSGAHLAQVLDVSTLLLFSSPVHKLSYLEIPPNVSMINNRKLVHRTTDMNGKEKVGCQLYEKLSIPSPKGNFYEKTEGSHEPLWNYKS